MPRMSGLEALRRLGPARSRCARSCLQTTIDRPQLLTAVQLGVRGLLLKDSTTELLFEAIVCVMAGRYWLGQSLVSDLVETVRPLSSPQGMARQAALRAHAPRAGSAGAGRRRVCEQGDRPPVRHQRADRQASSHPHFRQGRRLQPARARDGRARRSSSTRGRSPNGPSICRLTRWCYDRWSPSGDSHRPPL